MKKSSLFGATLALLGLTGPSTHTQTPTPTTSNYVQTTKIVGMKVLDSNGESVGTIKDVILDRETGCIAYTVISTGDSGTRLTGTTKTVAVPWSLYSQSPDPTVMTLTVDRERVYGAPAFEYSRINEYSTSNYIDNIYSYYGVQQRMGTSAKINADSSATPSPQASVSAQTEATASPVATETPSLSSAVTPTPTATPSPAPSETASPAATAKPKPPWASAASRPSATPSASANERKAEPPGEGPGSPAKKVRNYKDRASATPKPTPKKTTW